MLKRVLKFAIAATVGATVSLGAHATGDWPSKNFKVVVPYPAGGSADIVGRLVAKKLNEKFDNTAVVENVAGGATIPGALSVMRDDPDGHTIFIASDNTLNINTHLMKKLPYDADKDFTPITVINTYPHWLIASADGPHKDFDSLVEYIRANPGKASISVNTIGGSAHLGLVQWGEANGLDFEVIPYRGSPPAVQDLIGGLTDAHIDVVGSSIAQARGGRVVPLAALQSDPINGFPDAVTQPEDDPQSLVVRANLSALVRTGTPEPVIDAMYEAIREGAQETDFVEALDMLAYTAVLTPPAESREFILGETKRYGVLVEASGLEKQ